MRLTALDVIWIFDGTIRPPGPKMVACMEPALGLFFRINSKPRHQTSIKLPQSDHPFLKWDSYLECGEPLELDDSVVDEALSRKGVIGRVAPSLAGSIVATVNAARTITPHDKAAIRKALGIP